MANCSQCGAQLPAAGMLCTNCAAGLFARNLFSGSTPSSGGQLPPGVTISDHRDSHNHVDFIVLSSDSPYELCAVQRVDCQALIVREVRATLIGHKDDVALVLDHATACLQDQEGRAVFERPLGLLAITDRSMMTVLVEQDSPAGEALRRLGGAPIRYESPTRLATAALFQGGQNYIVRLFVQPVTLQRDDVRVRISLIGISKNHVA